MEASSSPATSFQNKIKDTIKVARSGSTKLLTLSVVAFVVIILIIIFIVWKMNRSRLQGKMIMKGPRKMNKPFTFPGDKLPPSSVGQEFTVSMWVFITDFQPTTKHKLLLARVQPSDESNVIMSMNPLIIMDRSTNRIHVCVGSNRYPITEPTCLNDIITARGVNKSFIVSTIDYVPLQRWVHIAAVVQDGLLTTYMDQSMYSVVSVRDLAARGGNPAIPVIGALTGDIKVGNFMPSMSSSGNGFIGSVQYWNHAVDAKSMGRVYSMGPSSINMLSGYGVRSPIYKREWDDDAKAEEED
jgi:hypothetical protein